MTRYSEPIENVRAGHTIHTGISYGPLFEEANAIVAAGATLDEVYKWWQGEYTDLNFRGFIVSLYRNNLLVELHANDARARAAEKGKK